MNTKQKSPSVKGEKIDGRKIKKLFERTFQSWQQHENETKRTGNYYSNEIRILQALEEVIVNFELWDKYLEFRNAKVNG